MTPQETRSWGVEQVWNGENFYDKGDVAAGQYAFVIDSGVALVDDLNVNTELSRSFVAGYGPHETNGHGTKVASIIGAKANGEGLTGVAPGAQIVSLKALNNGGRGSLRDITAALEYARDVIVEKNLFDSAVVNLSLGGNSVLGYPIIEEMADMGIKITIAAGNSAGDVDGYRPAGYGHHENVYTITSNTQGDTYSYFTNYDGLDLNGIDDTDFTAPGSAVPVYNNDGSITKGNGTSFAAPMVAGLLLMSEKIRPGRTFELSPDQIERGMVPDALAMFDPYTYKHGPRPAGPVPEGWYDLPPEAIPPTGPTPEPIYIEVPGPVVEVPVPGPVVEVPVPGPVVEVPIYIDVPGPVVEVPVPGPVVEVPIYIDVPGPVVEVPVPGPVVEVPVPGPEVEVPIYIEVPGPEVEVPIYIEVPGPEVEVPVYIKVPDPTEKPDVIIRGGMTEENNLRGTKENELILGGELKDVLKGSGGDDILMGFGGGDKIKGGKGDDLIDAGRDKSRIWGGQGADTFVLREGRGHAKLMDYDPSEDILGFDAPLDIEQKGDVFKILFEGDVLAKYVVSA